MHVGEGIHRSMKRISMGLDYIVYNVENKTPEIYRNVHVHTRNADMLDMLQNLLFMSKW